jgi:hypothetical protein
MSETTVFRSRSGPGRYIAGFVAACLATLVFHQIGLELCHLIGLTAGTPYNLKGVPPWGVPQVISLAFWGGLWGVPFVLVERSFPRWPGGYWGGAIIFGAIFPTAFSWFVVSQLKHLPLGYGFHFPGLLVGPIVNGLWGLGTGVFLGILPGAGTRPN